MKILIAIINNRPEVNIQFARSLIEMLFVTSNAGHEVTSGFYDYYDIAEMRNVATQDAIKQKVDFVFYMDADMIYPADTVNKLVAHNLDVVGGMYVTRKLPTLPVHFRKLTFDNKFGTAENRDYKFNTGLQETEAAGFGGVLVKMSVIEKMDMPYFHVIRKEDGSGFWGEDIYFYKILKDLGIKSYVDTSVNYGHVVNGAVYADGAFKIV